MTPFHKNTGKPPRDKSAEVEIIWANGSRARHTYKVWQLVWERRGLDFDIDQFKRAEKSR